MFFMILYLLTVPGLIIGTIITYTSPANQITSENVTLPFNSSFNYPDYPDALKLYLPVANGTEETKIYQYSHPEELSQAQQQDKGLEEKVQALGVGWAWG